jgi:hypothetical protein
MTQIGVGLCNVHAGQRVTAAKTWDGGICIVDEL